MKRIYGVRVNCELMRDFLQSIGDLRRAQKRGDVDAKFIKRIMLSVTHVNGCALCSWFHTHEALKIGMTQEEITRLLSGELSGAPGDEAAALVFAQHYADMRGAVAPSAWQRIVDSYGARKALGILAAIRMIMAGNAQGNIWGAFASRLKGKPEQGSSLGRELGVLAADIAVVPFMLVWAVFAAMIRRLVVVQPTV